MRPTVDVFILGVAAGPPSVLDEPSWPVSLRLFPTGLPTLPEFAAAPVSSQLAEGESELAALVTGNDRETLRSTAMIGFFLGDQKDHVARLVMDRVDLGSLVDPTQSWQATCGTRILLAPRAGHGPVVFRRSHLRQIGPLRPVAEPVWDWVIRAARAGRRINSSPIPDALRSGLCRLPLLVPPTPGPGADWLRKHLTDFTLAEFNPGSKPRSRVDEIALRAGLFQWHDFLNESHELSQSIEGKGENQLGDYWHAIMHRREPDYSNAKYWFRQIGNQPNYRELRSQADGILAACTAPDASRWRERLRAGSKWDPFAFVDLCEACAADETTDLALAARKIQYAEMSMLV